jgi:hypothetical protein
MTTTTTQPTSTTDLNLETLRAVADLEPFFEQLDTDDDPELFLSQALFFGQASEAAVAFVLAVLTEKLGVTLEPDEELSELSIIEHIDPAKGYPPFETRCYAALIALRMPHATDELRRNYGYLASYLLDEPNIGLSEVLGAMRAEHGLPHQGW